MQERARRWRRFEAQDILTRSMGEAGAGEGEVRGFITTAHHRDDQAETVLLKALRGAHITKMQARLCFVYCSKQFFRNYWVLSLLFRSSYTPMNVYRASRYRSWPLCCLCWRSLQGDHLHSKPKVYITGTQREMTACGWIRHFLTHPQHTSALELTLTVDSPVPWCCLIPPPRSSAFALPWAAINS